jgi:hypothetical protein
MLWQILEAMIAVHKEFQRSLELPRHAGIDRPALAQYERTISTYSGMIASTPVLAHIYGLLANHLSAARWLAQVYGDGSVPSWDPVARMNEAADIATTAIGHFAGGVIPIPSPVEGHVETTADLVRRLEHRPDGESSV